MSLFIKGLSQRIPYHPSRSVIDLGPLVQALQLLSVVACKVYKFTSPSLKSKSSQELQIDCLLISIRISSWLHQRDLLIKLRTSSSLAQCSLMNRRVRTILLSRLKRPAS